MSLGEKIGQAAAELEKAANEAVGHAKKTYEEKVTPEKRAELKNNLDMGVKKVETVLENAAGAVEKGVNDIVKGYNDAKK